MKLKIFLLVIFAFLTLQGVSAQPKPQDTSDIIWQKMVSSISFITFSPDSKLVLNGTDDGKVDVWNIQDSTLIIELNPNAGIINDMKFTKDGKFLCIANGGGVIIYDTQTWTVYKTYYDLPPVNSISLSPDEKSIACAAFENGIIIINFDDGNITKQIKDFPFIKDPKFGGQPMAWTVNYNQDGTKILFSGDRTILYDLTKETILKQYSGMYPLYSPDYTHFLTMNGSSTPKQLWLEYTNANTDIKEQTIQMGQDNFDFCFSPDGKNVITSGDNGKLQIWDINTLKEVYSFYFPQLYSLLHPSISNDGKYIAVESGFLFLIGPKYSPVHELDVPIIKTIYPNPATGTVKLEFNLQRKENINLLISNQNGQKINTFSLGLLDAGQNSYNYDSSLLPIGIYFLTLQSNSFSETFKLIKE